jgi:hypothetical protein
MKNGILIAGGRNGGSYSLLNLCYNSYMKVMLYIRQNSLKFVACSKKVKSLCIVQNNFS